MLLAFCLFGAACGALHLILEILDRMGYDVIGKILDARERRMSELPPPPASSEFHSLAGPESNWLVPVAINPPPKPDRLLGPFLDLHEADMVFASLEEAREFSRQHPGAIKSARHQDGRIYVYRRSQP